MSAVALFGATFFALANFTRPSSACAQSTLSAPSQLAVSHRGIVGVVRTMVAPMSALAGRVFGAMVRPGFSGLAALDTANPHRNLDERYAGLGPIGPGHGRPTRADLRSLRTPWVPPLVVPDPRAARGVLPPRASSAPSFRRPFDLIVEPRMDVIRAVIRRNLASLRACHEQAARSGARVDGRLALRFSIEPDGSVSIATTVDGDPGTVVVRPCVERAVRTWNFGHMMDTRFTVTYPFNFHTDP